MVSTMSSTLKERLNQYKVLKEEEERNAAQNAVSSATPTGTSQPDPPSPNENSRLDESWVAKVEESNVDADTRTGDDVTGEVGMGKDSHNSFSNTEEYEEEEIIENEQEFSERVVDDDDDDDDESFEEGAVDDVSFEEVNRDDQDVFRALDEAERAENMDPSQNPINRGNISRNPNDSAAKSSGKRGKCIILGLILISCIAIVAIVLPFFISYPQKASNGQNQNSQSVEPAPSSSTTTKPEASQQTESPTNAPTVTPTTLRWGQFLKLFLIPASGEEVFQDKKSPQYRAAKYLLDDPYTAELATTEELSDRYATVTFYFATEGENWNSCYFGDPQCEGGQWLVGDVCNWYAVSCNNDGRVSSYNFANAEGSGLVGSLPSEMYLLSKMTDLVIVNNTITGTLPETFGENATSMRSLLLPYNKLTGKIPDSYLSNSPLEFVHLGSNAFSGPIPSNIGDTVHLQQLDLSENLITGTIPDGFSRYGLLEALSFANNKVTGTIPSQIFGLTNLRFLHFNGNELDGTVSSSIGDLSSLKELRLGESKISGFIPDELYSLTDLVELDFSGAQLNGRLSLGLLNLEKLERLVVDNNNFIGTVPNSFGRMTSLNEFVLQGNDFTGSIPESVCALREENLEVLTTDCEKVKCECCSNCF
jgi:Leucine-rich repeat (LRR) protein